MEILTRTNQITPNPADPSPAETYTLTAQRTVHGIVHKRGTVGGKPVAFAKQRSTYFHEADSARGFADFNRPSKIENVQDFQRAAVEDRLHLQLALRRRPGHRLLQLGRQPRSAPTGSSFAVPNWGTGEWDWKNFNATNQTASYTPFAQHPQTVNQSYLTSWNNKQAPGFSAVRQQLELRAAVPLADARLPRRARCSPGAPRRACRELIDAMESAGSVDLRGEKVASWMLRVIGQSSDPRWPTPCRS